MSWPPRIVRTVSSNVPLAARPSVSVEPAIRTVTTFITSPGSQVLVDHVSLKLRPERCQRRSGRSTKVAMS